MAKYVYREFGITNINGEWVFSLLRFKAKDYATANAKASDYLHYMTERAQGRIGGCRVCMNEFDSYRNMTHFVSKARSGRWTTDYELAEFDAERMCFDDEMLDY